MADESARLCAGTEMDPKDGMTLAEDGPANDCALTDCLDRWVRLLRCCDWGGCDIVSPTALLNKDKELLLGVSSCQHKRSGGRENRAAGASAD
jgi:hypothetical protein